MPTVNRKAKIGKTYTQSVRFEKPKWSESAGRKWCKDHDFYTDGMDNAANEYRFRQYDPDYEHFTYKAFYGELPDGVYFINGYPK